MSEVYFTSDIHLGHKKIFEFCSESRCNVQTVDEHDELLIKNWNEQVTGKDTVYLLGDVSWHKSDKTFELLSRLNGNIQLVRGNHDHDFGTDGRYKRIFANIHDYREVKIDGHDVIMSHYPMAQWNKCHYGSFMLYGHCHGGFVNVGRSMDVGIDARPQKDMKLFTWEEVRDTLIQREFVKHH